MMRALVLQQWRSTLASPVRMTLALGVLVASCLGRVVAGRPVAPSLTDAVIAMALVSGVRGNDAATGVLHALVVRPVRWWDYVLARWLGGAALVAAALLLKTTLHVAGLAVVHGDAPSRPAVLGGFLASAVLTAAHVAAVMLLLSSLLPGHGDAGAVAVALLGVTAALEIGVPWEPARWIVAGLSQALPLPVDVTGRPFDEAARVAAVASLSLLASLLVLRARPLGTGRTS